MTTEFSKYKNMKKVVFKKDYNKHYRKGETHYIHKDIVAKKGLSAYATVSDVDFKGIYEKVRAQREKQKAA